jgi:anti-anti-sigma factor
MELQTKKSGNALIVRAKGRLDASWSDYFTDAFLGYIRSGEHQLVIDAREMHFLSSAGIRSLVLIHKELATVKGRFVMINTGEFVATTLRTTGLGDWIADDIPAEFMVSNQKTPDKLKFSGNCFLMDKNAAVQLQVVNNWKPWDKVKAGHISQIAFPANSFALGIGSPVTSEPESDIQFGDFLSAGGNLVYQPPEVKSHPDYLLPVENYIPELLTIQCLFGQGNMSYLLRFAPEDQKISHSLSELATIALELTGSKMAAFVVLAEIDGLVGAHLIQSPTRKNNTGGMQFNEMRNFLSFTGERVFSGEQAMVFGVVARNGRAGGNSLLKPVPSDSALAMHAHAVVFPFQPLQNGHIDLKQQIDKFFSGPPPRALLHLVNDNRPAIGLGESSFIRGALWCAPANFKEDII